MARPGLGPLGFRAVSSLGAVSQWEGSRGGCSGIASSHACAGTERSEVVVVSNDMSRGGGLSGMMTLMI